MYSNAGFSIYDTQIDIEYNFLWPCRCCLHCIPYNHSYACLSRILLKEPHSSRYCIEWNLFWDEMHLHLLRFIRSALVWLGCIMVCMHRFEIYCDFYCWDNMQCRCYMQYACTVDIAVIVYIPMWARLHYLSDDVAHRLTCFISATHFLHSCPKRQINLMFT